jgi:hypothetical protein
MSGGIISNPASRRGFLKTGLGLSAAGVLVRPVSARAAALSCYKAVFDERFAEARAFAAGASERRIATAAIRGDITRLFFEDLDLKWKQGPVMLAGYTQSASLFCLDLLARDRGMRVRHCVAQPDPQVALAVLDGAIPRGSKTTQLPPGDSSSPVFWIIAPRTPRGRWHG